MAKVSRPVPENLGRVIAVRRLRVPGHPTRAVTVRIGVPRRLGGGWDWGCPIEISGLGAPRLRYGLGVDAFQALQLSLDYIANRIAKAKPRPFLFEREDGGWFTRSLPTLPVKRQQSLQRVIDQAELRWVRTLNKSTKKRR